MLKSLSCIFSTFSVISAMMFSVSAVKAQSASAQDEVSPRSVFYTYTGELKGESKGTKTPSGTGEGGSGKGGIGKGGSGKGGSFGGKAKLPPVKPKPPKIKIVRYKKPEPPGNPNTKPRPKKPAPGAEIKVELTRNGITDFVPLDTLFQTDEDRVRLSIRTNFPAYVAVINRGSSGKITQLFPCKRGENFIQPFNSFMLPNTFKFSGDPGEDEVLFILSRQPLPLVNEIADEGFTVCKRKTLNSAFQAKMLDENLTDDKAGRDLEIADDYNNEGEPVNYLLLTEQLLKKTVVYKIRLRHQ